MDVVITSDANAESGIGDVVFELSGPTSEYFLTRDYGAGLLGVVVVLMCRDPGLRFHRRVRFVKKEKTLYMDVMLDLDEMSRATREVRRQIVTTRLLSEVPSVLGKYSLGDSDGARFEHDLKDWLGQVAKASLPVTSR